MRTLFFALCAALACSLLPAHSASPAAPVAVTPLPSAAKSPKQIAAELPLSVKKYLLLASADSMDKMADAAQQKQDVSDPRFSLIQVTDALKNRPTDELPEEYRLYLAEMLPVSEQMVNEIAALHGKVTASKVEEIHRRYEAQIEEIGSRYPSAHEVFAQNEKSAAVMKYLMAELHLENDIMEYAMKNRKSAKENPEKASADFMHFIAQKIRAATEK